MKETERKELRGLVREMKKDPNASFPRFYERTKRRVFYLLLSYVRNSDDAEDLLQDTYVAFLSSLDKVAASLNPLSYLLTSARNKAIDWLRSKSKEADLGAQDIEEISGTEFVYDDSSGLLGRIASLLTPLEFRTYVLHVLGDMTFKEIAKIVKRPIGTLTYTYGNAIGKLQKGLTEDGEWRI